MQFGIQDSLPYGGESPGVVFSSRHFPGECGYAHAHCCFLLWIGITLCDLKETISSMCQGAPSFFHYKKRHAPCPLPAEVSIATVSTGLDIYSLSHEEVVTCTGESRPRLVFVEGVQCEWDCVWTHGHMLYFSWQSPVPRVEFQFL